MARVMVVSENETIGIDVKQDDEGFTSGWCGACQDSITDRGHFEDTVRAIELHIEHHEARGEDQ